MSLSDMQGLYTRAMSASCLLDCRRGPPLVMPDEPMKPRIRPDGREFYEKDRAGSAISGVFQWDVKDDMLLPLDTAARKRQQKKNYISLNKEEVKRIENRVKNAHQKTKAEREEAKRELSKPLWKSDKRNNVAVAVGGKGPVTSQQPNVVANGHPITKPSRNPARYPLANAPPKHQHKITNDGYRKDQSGHNGPAAPGILHSGRSRSVDPLRLVDGAEIANGKLEAPEPNTPRTSGVVNGKMMLNNDPDTEAPVPRPRSAGNAIPNGRGKNANNQQKTVDALKIHAPGVVPKYIKERKKILNRGDHNDDRPGGIPKAPPGHVLMKAEEQDRTLASLKRAEAELLKRFNSLPVRTDTDYLKRKKQDLLRQLEEVDEAIKIFSRPKVYIKTDKF